MPSRARTRSHLRHHVSKRPITTMRFESLRVPAAKFYYILANRLGLLDTPLYANTQVFEAKNDGGSLEAVLIGQVDRSGEAYIEWLESLVKGKGAGRRLVEQFESWAEDEGAKRITLSVHDWDERALSFWKHMGYEVYDEPGDGYIDMEKRL